MKKNQLVFLLFFATFQLLQAQQTVHIQSSEFGRGILKSRAGECMAIVPYHVVEAGSGSATIIGQRNVQSNGTMVKAYTTADLAIVRIEGGGQQDCQEWEVEEDFDGLISNVYNAFLELRKEDGSVTNMQVFIPEKSDEVITIEPNRPNQNFSKGMSGGALFAIVNGEKKYLGMLLEIDAESGQGFVYQADDMMRILGGFFDGSSSGEETQQEPTALTHEENGLVFELESVRKVGTKVNCKFKVTSKEKDTNLGLNYNNIYFFDEKGNYTRAKTMMIGNSNGYSINHLLVQGVKTDLEVIFEGVSSAAKGMSLFRVGFREGNQRDGLMEFRNISFDGFNTGLVLPREKGSIEETLLGFDFQFIEYSKQGERVRCKFMVMSEDKDEVLRLNYNSIYFFDQDGNYTRAATMSIGNTQGYSIAHALVKGVQTPVEIIFDKAPTSAKGFADLAIGIKNGKEQAAALEFRGLSFEGFKASLQLPREQGFWEKKLLNFDWQFMDYRKTGDKLVYTFRVSSDDRDATLSLNYNNLHMYDERGNYTRASSMTIANTQGYSIKHSLIKGVQVVVTITFEKVAAQDGISVLDIGFRDEKDQFEKFEIRNLSFQGINAILQLPQEEGARSYRLGSFDFQFINYRKSGNKLICEFKVTNKERDAVLAMNYNSLFAYDEKGNFTRASTISVANSQGYSLKHQLIRQVQVPVIITFDNFSSGAEGISLLQIGFKDENQQSEQFEIRNLSFQGFDEPLILPYQEGSRSKNIAGFDFQYMNCRRSGTQTKCYFKVKNVEGDRMMNLNYNRISASFNTGETINASKMIIANTQGYSIGHYMVKGVQVPLEIIIDKSPSSSTSMSKLFLGFTINNNKQEQIELTNLSLE